MPNAATHKALGAVTGLAATHCCVTPLLRPEEEENGKPALLLTGLAAGGVGGRIPDLLDPPIHPNHRGLYHSVLAGCVVVGGAILTVKALKFLYEQTHHTHGTEARPTTTGQGGAKSSGISLKQAAIGAAVLAVLGAIASHLLADSGTPDGLPLVG